jgi:hypothetical protein
VQKGTLIGWWSGLALLCAAAGAGAADGSAGPAEHVEVFRPDGSRQCEPDSGTPPAAMRAELEAAGVTVHAARTGSDGMMYPQVCGAPTGRINVFSIDPAALADARALGFMPLGEPQ